jgi:hypothetical protein
MDFSKTFDKAPHKRLLYKLKYYGISQQAPEYTSIAFVGMECH